jgi:hypothetical protein
MERKKLDNKMLDSIGKRLVRSSAVAEADLDRVIADPELFSLILKRAAGQAEDPVQHSALFLFVRKNALAFAGAAILLMVVVGVASLLRPDKAPGVTKDQRAPAKQQEVVASPVFPPQEEPKTGKPSAGDADNAIALAEDDEFAVETAVHRPRRRNTDRRPVEPARYPEGDFYAVTFTGDKADTAAGGRIIRVELKRSSLFAMGVNLPLENDYEEMVTADLLVGKDGVTRGIRIVN